MLDREIVIEAELVVFKELKIAFNINMLRFQRRGYYGLVQVK